MQRPGTRASADNAMHTHVRKPRNFSRFLPLIALIAILVFIAGAIIVTTLTRAHVQLDDGTVWVTSLKDHKAARFNVKLKEAGGAIATKAARFDVAQSGDDTVLTDGSKVQNIQASSLSVHGSSETKSSTTTQVGGPTVAFLNTATGDVWTGESANTDSVSPSSATPSMRLGSGGKVAVDHDGAVYGYRPADGAIVKLDGAHATPHTLKSITGGSQQHADSFTVINDKAVVSSGHTLIWQGGKAQVQSHGTMTLQAPPTDDKQGDWVTAATPKGLVTVDLGHSGKSHTFATSGSSQPAQPVSTGGCAYAAWSQASHNFIRICSADEASAPDVKRSNNANRTASFSSLESVSPTSQLVFRTGHRQVVLNDVNDGTVWNPNESPKAIKIQWKTIQTKKATSQEHNSDSANNETRFKPTCTAKSGTIKAQDDQFGARAGSEQILDVLRNDEQTDCSIIRISKVGPVSDAGITVTPVYAGRYLQLDATNAKAGTATFSYEIDDGKGQTSQANVTLTLSGATANRAPVQSDTPPEYDVEQGASLTVNALGSFTDPDGDPLTLVAATPENNGQVTATTRADGQLIFNSGSATGGRIAVNATVSDGQATGTGIIYFSVRPANTLPALIDATTKTTTPGTSTDVELKDYIHGTSAQPPLLTQVDSPAGTTTSASPSALSFTFVSQTPGTYTVPYTVSQGSVTTQGLVRIEVEPASGESAKPVAANDVALLGADRTAIVEPLHNDVDPMGGVLSVTSVDADPKLGIKTGLVAHKRVYMTARQIPTKPVSVSYTVANAIGSSKGTIVLQPPALSVSTAVPKAANLEANVRTGGIVSVDILDHVSHPDGTTVTLGNTLQYDRKTFKGLAFVSGDEVRYQASGDPGTYPVTYTVQDNLGNAASGLITINVHAKNAATKSAPTPHDAEAQVAAGQKVRIPITMTGIDADGDDDTLLGLGNSAPKLGRIDEVGADYIVYESYVDSSGTDTFSYAVEDWTGQRAQAQIRVGVFKGASDSGVYARDDTVTLRPNTRATVPVTQNDISGDNTDLKLSDKLEAQGLATASAQDNMVSLTTPATAGTAYVIYTVHDKAGLTDTATLTVITDPKAPIDPPTAYDYRVPSAATIDRKSVDVDVKDWIANPSGTTAELKVGIDPSAQSHARVKGGAGSTTLSVDLTNEARSVPYTVTNTTYHITSTAFIQVPAYGVFPPTLRPKAPPIRVNAKQTVTIDIADYVRVGAGKTAYVDKDSISATKAANSDFFAGDQTLRFTAPRDYAGPASITFTVSDGKQQKGDEARRTDKNGNTQGRIINSSTLTLPITIIGRNVPPPTFSPSTIDVVAGGESKTIDLKALTHAPSGIDADEKHYTYKGGETSGPITSHLTEGGTLTLKAPADAAVGSVTSIPITIGYSNGSVSAGMTAQVVQSDRPLAKVPGAHQQIKAGSSSSVNLLSGAFNPFPDKPLTLTECASDDSSKLHVDCRPDGTVTIKAASDIGASSNTVVATIQDATKARERQVSATITVSVIDKPDAPLLSPIAGRPADSSVNLFWTPGNANGSPITEYEVDWDTGSKSCGAVTSCAITGLTNGREYSFSVKARNEAGWSKPSVSVTGKPDKVPDAPANITLTGGYHKVTVSWAAPSYTGSAPDDYTVTMNGQVNHTSGLSTTFDLPDNAITGAYSASVQGHNRAGDGQTGTSTTLGSDGGPWGDPDAPAVSFTQTDEDHMTITVTPGNLRNAGCSTIKVSGDYEGSVPCEGGSLTPKIKSDDYYTPRHIDVTLTPKQSGAKSATASANATPTYAIPTPQSASLSLNDGRCTLRWTGQGRHDGYTLSGSNFSGDVGLINEETSSRITPWTSCGTASVRQRFNGRTGDAIEAHSDDVYKVKAKIDEAPTLTWSKSERNTIEVDMGRTETWGQPNTMTLTLDGHAVTVTPKTTSIDVGAIPDFPADAGDRNGLTWTFDIVGADAALNNSASGTVKGSRKSAPNTTEPSDSTSPDSSDSSEELDIENKNIQAPTRLRNRHIIRGKQ